MLDAAMEMGSVAANATIPMQAAVSSLSMNFGTKRRDSLQQVPPHRLPGKKLEISPKSVDMGHGFLPNGRCHPTNRVLLGHDHPFLAHVMTFDPLKNFGGPASMIRQTK